MGLQIRTNRTADLTNTRKWLDEVTIGTAKEVHTEIVRRTPYDSGAAKLNWQIALMDNPQTIPLPEAGLSQSAAEQRAIAMQDNLPEKLPPGAKVQIFNNLPYIGALENGHSNQAPAGMVRGALQKVLGR